MINKPKTSLPRISTTLLIRNPERISFRILVLARWCIMMESPNSQVQTNTRILSISKMSIRESLSLLPMPQDTSSSHSIILDPMPITKSMSLEEKVGLWVRSCKYRSSFKARIPQLVLTTDLYKIWRGIGFKDRSICMQIEVTFPKASLVRKWGLVHTSSSPTGHAPSWESSARV